MPIPTTLHIDKFGNASTVLDGTYLLLSFNNGYADNGVTFLKWKAMPGVMQCVGSYKMRQEDSLLVPARYYAPPLLHDLQATNQECVIWLFDNAEYRFANRLTNYAWAAGRGEHGVYALDVYRDGPIEADFTYIFGYQEQSVGRFVVLTPHK